MTGKGTNNPERGGNPWLTGVGPAHSRGKGGVTPVEPVRALEGAGGNTQSKGETAAAHRSGEPLLTKLELITRRAKQEPRCRFVSLTHLLDEEFLTQSYRALDKKKATGADGVSVEEYGGKLEENLKKLVERMKAGKYWPQPVRRVYIPKGEHLRPLGIPAVEDKVVQKGMAIILEAVFEGDFLDVSYGYRPKRGCHEALKALDRAIKGRPVSYVVEVDIKGFFGRLKSIAPDTALA